MGSYESCAPVNLIGSLYRIFIAFLPVLLVDQGFPGKLVKEERHGPGLGATE